MRSFAPFTIGSLLALGLLVQQPSAAQIAIGDLGANHRVTIAALTAADVTQSTSLITRMVQARELTSFSVQDDPMIAGRRIESLRQTYQGIPVEGGGVTLQFAGATTISIFGTLYTDITIDATPAITAIDAARIIERESRRLIAFGAVPTLVVRPSPVGTFALLYKAAVEDAVTYYVDAATGVVVQVVDEKRYDVGVGTGVLGDQKKMSTTQIGGTYRTRDTLRPAGISTFDTGGSSTVLDRMLNTGVTSDGDLGSDADNSWTDGRIVDAHTNTGATYDYFYRRHNWSGLDGLNRPISDIVHRGLKNNAFFAPPPFGPERNGAMVYGETTGGVPVTALDVAAHELMHGVTEFSLRRRTGTGVIDALLLDTGPATFVFNGTTFSCPNTVIVDSQGVQRPFLCSNGRYVVAANHPGAVNEAFSDIFGTSVEFFYQSPGSGALKADYQIGEDISGLGPVRSMSTPGAITIAHDTGSVPYPDHASRVILYTLIITAGSQSNPTALELVPIAFVNGSAVFFLRSNLTDGGGVHLNATVLGHAFYLAVEGGRNATSGLSVSGVGSQNREQIERAFFRAMTQLMPNVVSMNQAAAAVIQASTDLYSANSPATQAITQAMVAVGLR